LERRRMTGIAYFCFDNGISFVESARNDQGPDIHIDILPRAGFVQGSFNRDERVEFSCPGGSDSPMSLIVRVKRIAAS
jgi:hypothetical protein